VRVEKCEIGKNPKVVLDSEDRQDSGSKKQPSRKIIWLIL